MGVQPLTLSQKDSQTVQMSSNVTEVSLSIAHKQPQLIPQDLSPSSNKVLGRSGPHIAPDLVGHSSVIHAGYTDTCSEKSGPLIQNNPSQPLDVGEVQSVQSGGATRPPLSRAVFQDVGTRSPTRALPKDQHQPHDQHLHAQRQSETSAESTIGVKPFSPSKAASVPRQVAPSQPRDPSRSTAKPSEPSTKSVTRVTTFSPPKSSPQPLDPCQTRSQPSIGSTIRVLNTNLEDKVSLDDGGNDKRLGLSRPKRRTHKPFWMDDYV
ncbi:hypothetical protein SESBI_27989 [Sesbania bispinosa]|nr:hypothetical protein SESBI_27989 [Sesbania bispinosa]